MYGRGVYFKWCRFRNPEFLPRCNTFDLKFILHCLYSSLAVPGFNWPTSIHSFRTNSFEIAIRPARFDNSGNTNEISPYIPSRSRWAGVAQPEIWTSSLQVSGPLTSKFCSPYWFCLTIFCACTLLFIQYQHVLFVRINIYWKYQLYF